MKFYLKMFFFPNNGFVKKMFDKCDSLQTFFMILYKTKNQQKKKKEKENEKKKDKGNT